MVTKDEFIITGLMDSDDERKEVLYISKIAIVGQHIRELST